MTADADDEGRRPWGALVVLAGGDIPNRWRHRSDVAAVIPLTPEEAAFFLADEPVRPALRPDDEQVLSLVLAGATVTAIARRLGVSPRSVQRRLARLRSAFGAASNTHLAVAAARAGFR